jgi:hypothetical protein
MRPCEGQPIELFLDLVRIRAYLVSRWHDHSPAGLAAWANLSPEERIADRLVDILTAAIDIEEIWLVEGRSPQALADFDLRAAMTIICTITRALLKPLPSPPPFFLNRDPELAVVLDLFASRLSEVEMLGPSERDTARNAIEADAAPWVLAFLYEIQRLDRLNGRSDR